MTEEFLQYVWKHLLFEKNGITTTFGEPIEIINPGKWNTDAGPDFFNASIRIGKTLWAGNVEVHKKSSDWNLHGHSSDASYNNVILHVVLKHDTDIHLSDGSILPAFIPSFSPQIWENYNELQEHDSWPSCSDYIRSLDVIYISSALNSLLIERLRSKTNEIVENLQQTNNDWSETFYRLLARNFGFKTNALPFEMLAKCTPLKILSKHKKNLLQTEAILFGQSGLLNEQLLGDEHFLQLREEYCYLSRLHHLKGMEGHVWKFLRLRPVNFPTIRIAQFAALLHESESLLSKLIETTSPSEILQFFKVKASEYWDTHYKFNMPSVSHPKWIGETSATGLLINTVAPFLFIYGDRNNKEELKTRAIELLESLPPEQNNITDRWDALGIKATNAFDSQALIQLKNVYCDGKKCLNCQLGNKVINR